MTTFDGFIADLAEEARTEGPDAVAELDTFGVRFSLARQLAARRRALRLSQRQLSERTAIERAEISRIERGEVDVTTTTLGTLTPALGVDVSLVPR
jgi:XRE family transcriptional regulator, regulator of sulfur utilization